MDRRTELASCLVHNGTVVSPRDMIRAMETVEGLTYRQILDGETLASGRATLVKIMAEPGASTILVNECLFLNVLSFRYLTFETEEDGTCRFELAADGMTLEIVPTDDEEEGATATPRAVRLLESEAFDSESYVVLDDDDEDDGR